MKPVQPWDLLDPRSPKTPRDIARGRLDICEACDDYHARTRQCGICHCVMPLKVHLANAECPAGRWSRVTEGMGEVT